MNYCTYIILALMTLASCSQEPSFKWKELNRIPDPVGFAGSFAGVSNGILLVAGGANFPDGGAPWTGSEKVWHDRIFALEDPEGSWREVGKLPVPLGYGVSLSTDEGLLCIGGNNAKGHFDEGWILSYKKDSVELKMLPKLPKPIANAAGIIIDDVVYVMGGTFDNSSQEAGSNFWSLNLENPAEGWKILPTWPGPSRMLSVTAVADGSLYLFSGAHLKNGKREYLKDAYKYTPASGWIKIADIPAAVVAAPTPAYTGDGQHIYIFGGDDGSLVSLDLQKQQHPGFSKKIWRYAVKSDTWTEAGQQPGEAAVTTPLVVWNRRIVIPGGEVRPSVRTSTVLTLHPDKL